MRKLPKGPYGPFAVSYLLTNAVIARRGVLIFNANDSIFLIC